MKQLIFILICIGLFSCISCNKESLPQALVWRFSFNNKNTSGAWVHIYYIAYYENKVILSKTENNKNSIIALNAESGDLEWSWNDWLGPDESYSFNIQYSIIYKSYFYFDSENKIYVIDLKNGKTTWKEEPSYGFNLSSTKRSIDNIVFSSSDKIKPDNFFEWTILYLDMNKLNNNYSYSVFKETGDVLYRANNPTPYKNSSGEICLLFTYSIPKDDEKLSWGEYKNLQWFLGAYNVDQKKYEYKDSTKTRFFDRSIMHENKIYGILITDDENYKRSITLFRYDPITRKKDWEVPVYPHASNSSSYPMGYQMAYYEGKLYVSGNQYAGCFDANTGYLKWVNLHGGNAQSPFGFLNEVVYWTNAGYLYAVDANNGQVFWGISQEGNTERFSSSNLAISIGIIPTINGGKGGVVIHDYEYAYCFGSVEVRLFLEL